VIRGFRGDFAWLSNFFPATVVLDGEAYPTVEHAYQAAKALRPKDQKRIREAPSPGRAKRLGRTLEYVRFDWDEYKVPLMRYLLAQKFEHEGLKLDLLGTYPQPLVEGNTWHDTFWGVCECPRCGHEGRNMLGRLLMDQRTHLRGEASHYLCDPTGALSLRHAPSVLEACGEYAYLVELRRIRDCGTYAAQVRAQAAAALQQRPRPWA
jgi:ribA/ribD-fused uncharacterized protein